MSDESPSADLLAADLAELAAERPDAPRLAAQDAERLGAALSYEPAPLAEGAWEALEAKLVAEDEAPRVSLSCTYCHDGLRPSAGQALAYCASCLAPHHRDCFEDHARCSAPGCAETRWVQPQSSGAAPQPAIAVAGKPELRVLPREEPAARPKRQLRTLVAVVAASLIGVSAAGLAYVRGDLGQTPPLLRAEENTVVALTFVNTLEAGTILISDHLVTKEVGRERVAAWEASESPPVTEAMLAGFLGRRLDQRVLAGEPVRVGLFRAPAHLPQGATLETYVFTHDVQPGEVLSAGDFERRRVRWSMVWEAPGQGLLLDSQVRAFVGRRLSRVGRGGEPLRHVHFEALDPLPEATPEGAWVPTPAEEALALSPQGRNLIRLARPVERARAYLVHHGLEEGVDLEQVKIASYCPPQPTAYSWLVTFQDPEGKPLYVAVSEAGRTWQLDEKFEVVRPDEFERGGLQPR